jgi:LysM repeat protein
MVVENPKKDIALSAAKLSSEPACLSSGSATGERVQLFTGGSQEQTHNFDQATTLLRGIREFFDEQANCDEQFVFAYYNETVAGVYIGSKLGKGTVHSTLQDLGDQYAQQLLPPLAVAEFCHTNGTDPDHVFGITIETGRHLATVQDTVREWSNGNCFVKERFTSAGALPGANVLQIPTFKNSTLNGNTTSQLHGRGLHGLTHSNSLHSSARGHHVLLNKRATCSYMTVADGDTCPSLVKKCGITSPNFVKYNPKTNLCSTLKVGEFVCCSAGDLPSSSVVAPKPDADGVCATHLIQNGDTCSALATKYGITVVNIEKWNKGKTWAWTACKDMLLGYNMCVSDGFAPMPPSQAGVSPPQTMLPDGIVNADLTSLDLLL